MDFGLKEKLSRLDEEGQRERDARADEAVRRLEDLGKQTLAITEQRLDQRGDRPRVQEDEAPPPKLGQLSRVLYEHVLRVPPKKAQVRRHGPPLARPERVDKHARQTLGQIDSAIAELQRVIRDDGVGGDHGGLNEASRLVEAAVASATSTAQAAGVVIPIPAQLLDASALAGVAGVKDVAGAKDLAGLAGANDLTGLTGANDLTGLTGAKDLAGLAGAKDLPGAGTIADAPDTADPAVRPAGPLPLEPGLRREMESAFDTSFEDVRVHVDGAAESVGAEAFARGTDIHFAPGKYAPGTPEGKALLGHELTHVVQQRQGIAEPFDPQHRRAGEEGSADSAPPLEAEADVVGARVAKGERAGHISGAAARGAEQRKDPPGAQPGAQPRSQMDARQAESLAVKLKGTQGWAWNNSSDMFKLLCDKRPEDIKQILEKFPGGRDKLVNNLGGGDKAWIVGMLDASDRVTIRAFAIHWAAVGGLTGLGTNRDVMDMCFAGLTAAERTRLKTVYQELPTNKSKTPIDAMLKSEESPQMAELQQAKLDGDEAKARAMRTVIAAEGGWVRDLVDTAAAVGVIAPHKVAGWRAVASLGTDEAEFIKVRTEIHDKYKGPFGTKAEADKAKRDEAAELRAISDIVKQKTGKTLAELDAAEVGSSKDAAGKETNATRRALDASRDQNWTQFNASKVEAGLGDWFGNQQWSDEAFAGQTAEERATIRNQIAINTGKPYDEFIKDNLYNVAEIEAQKQLAMNGQVDDVTALIRAQFGGRFGIGTDTDKVKEILGRYKTTEAMAQLNADYQKKCAELGLANPTMAKNQRAIDETFEKHPFLKIAAMNPFTWQLLMGSPVPTGDLAVDLGSETSGDDYFFLKEQLDHAQPRTFAELMAKQQRFYDYTRGKTVTMFQGEEGELYDARFAELKTNYDALAKAGLANLPIEDFLAALIDKVEKREVSAAQFNQLASMLSLLTEQGASAEAWGEGARNRESSRVEIVAQIGGAVIAVVVGAIVVIVTGGVGAAPLAMIMAAAGGLGQMGIKVVCLGARYGREAVIQDLVMVIVDVIAAGLMPPGAASKWAERMCVKLGMEGMAAAKVLAEMIIDAGAAGLQDLTKAIFDENMYQGTPDEVIARFRNRVGLAAAQQLVNTGVSSGLQVKLDPKGLGLSRTTQILTNLTGQAASMLVDPDLVNKKPGEIIVNGIPGLIQNIGTTIIMTDGKQVADRKGQVPNQDSPHETLRTDFANDDLKQVVHPDGQWGRANEPNHGGTGAIPPPVVTTVPVPKTHIDAVVADTVAAFKQKGMAVDVVDQVDQHGRPQRLIVAMHEASGFNTVVKIVEGDPVTGRPKAAIAADDFDQAHVAKRVGDDATAARKTEAADNARDFAEKMAAASNDALEMFTAGKSPDEVYAAMMEWRAKQNPNDPKLRTPITDPADPNYDPFGVMPGKRDAHPEGGGDTAEMRQREAVGKLIEGRFEGHDGDRLVNMVELPDGTKLEGNILHRGESADDIAARKDAAKTDPAKRYGFEPGAPKLITETAHPEHLPRFHKAGIDEIHRLNILKERIKADPALRAKALEDFANAAYLLFMGPTANRGSDATIRVFLMAAFTDTFGHPPRLPQDIDVQAYARDQAAFKAWLAGELARPRTSSSGDGGGGGGPEGPPPPASDNNLPRPRPARPHVSSSEAVPGSDFRGNVNAPDTRAIGEQVGKVLESVVFGFRDGKAPKPGTPDEPHTASFKVAGEDVAVSVKPVDFGEDVTAVARTVRRPDGGYDVEVSARARPDDVERALAHELAALYHRERRARLRGENAGDNALVAGNDGSMLSPDDMGRIAELRVLYKRLEDAKLRAAKPADVDKLRSEVLVLEKHLGLHDASGERQARVLAIMEVEGDRSRRDHRADELDRGTGHSGKEVHNHFLGNVESDVFRDLVGGGPDSSWVPVLQAIDNLEAPQLRHKFDADGKVAADGGRGISGEAMQNVRKTVEAIKAEEAKIPMLQKRADAGDAQARVDLELTRRRIETMAENAVNAAMRATEDTDYNSSYEIMDEMIKLHFGGADQDAFKAKYELGDTVDNKTLDAYVDHFKDRPGLGVADKVETIKRDRAALAKLEAQPDATPASQKEIERLRLKLNKAETSLGEQFAYDQYSREALLRLAQDGLDYSEQSNSTNKMAARFDPDAIRAAKQQIDAMTIDQLRARFPGKSDAELVALKARTDQLDVRFLTMMNTSEFGAAEFTGPELARVRRDKSPDADPAKPGDKSAFDVELERVKRQLERDDIVGVDIAGQEHYVFDKFDPQNPDMNNRFLRLAMMLAEGVKPGQKIVLRPHVGEGAIDTTAGDPFGRDVSVRTTATGEPEHVRRGRENIETLLNILEYIAAQNRKAPGTLPEGLIVRFGHATNATPEQALRMAVLGIIAEVNLGSNIQTGATPQNKDGVPDRRGRTAATADQRPIENFDDHALITFLYYGTQTVLSTDGPAAMSTNMRQEYQRARRLIEEVLYGERPIRVDPHAARQMGVEPTNERYGEVYFHHLSPESQKQLLDAYKKLYDDANKYFETQRPKDDAPPTDARGRVKPDDALPPDHPRQPAPQGAGVDETAQRAAVADQEAKIEGVVGAIRTQKAGELAANTPDVKLVPPPEGTRVIQKDATDALIGLPIDVIPATDSFDAALQQMQAEGIPRWEGLTAKERAHETAYVTELEANLPIAIETFFRQSYDSRNDTYIFEVDGAKKLYSQYGTKGSPEGDGQRDVRATANHALHPAAVAIARLAFLKRLDEMQKLPAGHPAKQIFVTNGGCAAGKGSLTGLAKDLAAADGGQAKFGAVWDAAGEGDSMENGWILAAAQQRGLKVLYGYVENDPTTQYQGVLARAANTGRIVDPVTFARSYTRGAENMKAFMESPAYKQAVADGTVEALGVKIADGKAGRLGDDGHITADDVKPIAVSEAEIVQRALAQFDAKMASTDPKDKAFQDMAELFFEGGIENTQKFGEAATDPGGT